MKNSTPPNSRRDGRNNLADNQEIFKLLVEGVNDYAIFMLDPQGFVATWNKGAERAKGFQADEIIGQHFSKFYPEIDIQNKKPDFELKEAIAQGRFEDEGWRIRKDGTRFWANVIITPIFDNSKKHIGFSKVTRDLTERKKAEDDLRLAYEQMESRVKLRTHELSIAKLKAESAVKVRDQFFSMASHELKTPLSALRLQIQMRQRRISKEDFSDFRNDRVGQVCDDQLKQLDRLSFLVNNMLNIAKLTSGQLELQIQETNLNDLLAGVIKRMEPVLKDSGNQCVVKATTVVNGLWDQTRLEQVFSNILSNASKYAPGKPIDIEISCTPDVAQIVIRDYGPGISKDDQERIFQPFERLKTESGASGLGLGLHIVREMIAAHHGHIRLQSGLGEGATFTIEIPLGMISHR